MALGAVKWFNTKKGYGFLSPDEGDRDVFVHITALHRVGLESLSDGQRVEFSIQQNIEGRTSAGDIRLITD